MIYTDGIKIKSAILCHGENTNIIYKQQRYRPINRSGVSSNRPKYSTEDNRDIYHRTENEFLWLRWRTVFSNFFRLTVKYSGGFAVNKTDAKFDTAPGYDAACGTCPEGLAEWGFIKVTQEPFRMLKRKCQRTRDGVLENCPRPRGQNSVASKMLFSNTSLQHTVVLARDSTFWICAVFSGENRRAEFKSRT